MSHPPQTAAAIRAETTRLRERAAARAELLADHETKMAQLAEMERRLRWQLTGRRAALEATPLGRAALADEDAARRQTAATPPARLSPRLRALLALTPLGRRALAEEI